MARDFPPGTIPARGFDWDRVVFPPRRVGEFADLLYGKSLVESKHHSGSVPVYGTNGRCGWHNEGLQPGPGVILGRKGQGPLGVEWCDGSFWVIDTAYFATVAADVDLKWFYYIVKYVGLIVIILRQQRILNIHYLKTVPKWYLRLQLSPRIVYVLASIGLRALVAVPAYFDMTWFAWANRAPRLPQEDEEQIRELERHERRQRRRL